MASAITSRPSPGAPGAGRLREQAPAGGNYLRALIGLLQVLPEHRRERLLSLLLRAQGEEFEEGGKTYIFKMGRDGKPYYHQVK